MKNGICHLVLIIVCFYMAVLHAADDKLTKIIKKQTNINLEAVKVQKKINKLSDESRKSIEEYKQVIQQIENFTAYNNHLERMIRSQRTEEDSLLGQLDSIDVTSQGIIPLMLKMINSLEKYVELDVPFLFKERQQRIKNIRKMMVRADISTSEKYRRILEAYQIEMDYGRTMETYTDNILINKQNRSVNFLRLGRVVFIYQTLDGSQSSLWDPKLNIWKAISDDYNREVMKAIRVAQKQLPPELIVFPVRAPEILR